MTTRDRNLRKIKELVPSKQWAVIEWEEACREEGCEIKISEAHRTQERQNKLHEQGRTTTGNIVTYTRRSKHTERLALDVYAAGGESTNKFYATIAMIGRRYYITHPYADWDKPHFEITNVPPRDIRPTHDRLKMIHNARLTRLVGRLVSKPRSVATRTWRRIRARFPWFPLD